MLYLSLPVSILEVLIVAVPVLLSVAFVTVAERKTMASMQRRLGPNVVGYYGLLQAFADALKLLIKEYVSPTQANLVLFFLGPVITLIFSLLGFAVIPYGPGLAVFDFNLGILYFLAVSSLATYGILLAGWSANSKYAFLGSLRSTAQLISYELVLTSAILIVILFTSSLSLTVNIEFQRAVWFIIPLFPLFIIFFISCVAETNRAPFDLAEAESELVSGFMTEHSAVIFVFFFLAEYASLVLMCIIVTILFIGGYNINFYYVDNLYYMAHHLLTDIEFVTEKLYYVILGFYYNSGETTVYSYEEAKAFYYFRYDLPIKSLTSDFPSSPILTSCFYGLVLGIKSILMVFVFIWIRASFPRIRFDQLMSYSWTVLLPLVFAFIIALPVLTNVLDLIPRKDLM